MKEGSKDSVYYKTSNIKSNNNNIMSDIYLHTTHMRN